MWQPLSKILDAMGRVRLPVGPSKQSIRVGVPGAADARGGNGWRAFSTSETLYDVWGPVPESVWEPYHCVPLFAALDRIRPSARGSAASDDIWPTPPETAAALEIGPHLPGAARGEPLGREWAAGGVWIILDLPGMEAVTLATRFVLAGYQPVCTFNHWPHVFGVLHPEAILSQLLRFAPIVAEARRELLPASPPMWICDRNRLGTRPGRPKEFDNRYYLDDASLPGPAALRKAGIEHIVCIVPELNQSPLADLRSYLAALHREGFSQIHGAALNDPELRTFQLMTHVDASEFGGAGYQRSAAGGFGKLIPEPSSGGG